MTLYRLLPALALTALLSLTACDTTGPDGPGPGPDPDPVTVTFDWNRVQVIRDCEGAATGDFEFIVKITSTIDGVTNESTLLDGDFAVDAGRSVLIRAGDSVFTVPGGADATFVVSLFALERDIVGNDLDETGTLNHALSTSGISPSGSQTITLRDGSNCEVELQYSVSSS